MTFLAADTETVTRLRPPPRNNFGDIVGSVSEVDVTGCLFAPTGSSELADGANQVDTSGTVYAPVGTDIVATDRLRIRGVVYQVVGEPEVWNTLGVVATVRRVTG